MQKAKSFTISEQLVFESWLAVKSNKGSAGIDGTDICKFEKDLENNLYQIWNRMSSGSYMPHPVKLVEIPKSNGEKRPLGIPTITDRIAQMVVVKTLESKLEPVFHEDSYGYRPNKSAHDAVNQAQQRCWKYDWVLDMDIKGFFDNINHDLLLKALLKHTDSRWVILYIKRWLTVPYQNQKGELVEREKGVPQGSVIGPLLSNLFLHYAFDEWMRRNNSTILFERYADDIICHCASFKQAESLRVSVKERLSECNLELSEEKTQIVYCKRSGRNENYANIKFDFLGFTFRPRLAKSKKTGYFVSFLPAISNKAKKRITKEIRKWNIHLWTDKSLPELAQIFNPKIQGWINYYGKFHKSAISPILKRLNYRLSRWVVQKFKRFRQHKRRAWEWLGLFASKHPGLFAQWRFGLRPLKTITVKLKD